MRRCIALLSLLFGTLLCASGCGAGTPGACRPGINECMSRCPAGGQSDVHEHPPMNTRNSETPCVSACRSQYCR